MRTWNITVPVINQHLDTDTFVPLPVHLILLLFGIPIKRTFLTLQTKLDLLVGTDWVRKKSTNFRNYFGIETTNSLNTKKLTVSCRKQCYNQFIQPHNKKNLRFITTADKIPAEVQTITLNLCKAFQIIKTP